jgi:DNA uptake protein ComE-like DNA-binding protein
LKRSFLFLPGSEAKKHVSGAILFIAVGSIAILSILTLGVTSSVLQELRLAKTVTEANTSFYSAYSVLSAMNVIWANDATPAVITLYDLRERQISFGSISAQVTFSDEEAKINVENASRNVLLKLPGMAGQESLAGRIVAEWISVKEQLLLIDGMTQEIYNGIKDLITTFGAGAVNINTASRDCLLTLMRDALITPIFDFRNGPDGKEGTEDDRVFASTSEIIVDLASYGLTPEQQERLEDMISNGKLGVTSDHIRVDIVLKKAGKAFRSFQIVTKLSTGGIVSWTEQ